MWKNGTTIHEENEDAGKPDETSELNQNIWSTLDSKTEKKRRQEENNCSVNQAT